MSYQPYDLQGQDEIDAWIARHPGDEAGAEAVLGFFEELRVDPLAYEATPIPGTPEGWVTRDIPDTEIWTDWCTDSSGKIIWVIKVESTDEWFQEPER